jgi:hypothetical protein
MKQMVISLLYRDRALSEYASTKLNRNRCYATPGRPHSVLGLLKIYEGIPHYIS